MCGTPDDNIEYELKEECITTLPNEVKYILTDDQFVFYDEYKTFREVITWFEQNMNLRFVLKQSAIVTKIADGRCLYVKKRYIK